MKLSLESAFKQAEHYQKNNHFNDALSLYEKILNFKPKHLPTLINLGNLFQQKGNLDKAKYYFEKSLSLNNQNSELIFHLAILYYKTNDLEKCLKNFHKLQKQDPNYLYLRYNLLNVLRSNLILELKKTNRELVEDLFLFLFKYKDIDHSAISQNVLFFLFNKKELKELNNEEDLLTTNFIKRLIKKELFHLILQKILLSDNDLEKTLTLIRRDLLLNKIEKNFLLDKKNNDFLISLAEQCWLNEYIWFVNKDEKTIIKNLVEKIENDSKIYESDIALLACYLPLNSSNKIKKKLLDYKSNNVFFNDLIDVQIREPKNELELKNNIKSVSRITDYVSSKVRNQYEENPYPRWRYCNQLFSIDFEKDVNIQIKPNKIKFVNKTDKLNILLAGCGTGKHLMSVGMYKNSNVLAIDLSLNSLAYAKRKVIENGYKNIKFLHSDILDLRKLDQTFDHIECVGTLHHMNNPDDGFKSLLKVSKPGGLLRLGLYSDLARQDVIKLREIVKSKNFKPIMDDIRALRKFILSENETSGLFNSIFMRDFYSTSDIRDLLFHVHEQRYTIPKLIKNFRDFNLEFLGFVHNDFVKYQYSKLFPNDKEMINLEYWNEFEIKFPNTFLGMYQFYVKNNSH